MWISFFFHLLCPCYRVLLSEKVRNVSGTSQVHREDCKLGHLIYLMNCNTVAILTSIILVAVDIVAVLCIIKTRANSVTLDYFCYCYKIWQCDYGHSSVQSGHFQFSDLIIPSVIPVYVFGEKNNWQFVFSAINKIFTDKVSLSRFENVRFIVIFAVHTVIWK